MRTLPLILFCLGLAVPALRADRLNLVVILADDLGIGDVRALNLARGKIPTPHLDRLAAQGRTFTDAHSGSSVCTPTRYGLLTGRYAWRTRLQRGVLDGGDDPPLVAATTPTVGGFLGAHGYTTALIGKWHLGFSSESPTPDAKPAPRGKQMGWGGLPVGTRIPDGPLTRGFSYFWGCSNARTMSGLIENDRVIESLDPQHMLPRLGRRAVDYVGEHAAAAREGRPFFLYLALTSPHTPILPSAEWKGRSGLGDYADFVMQTDAVVGDVLGALEKHGLDRDTLLLFTADNGCSPQAGVAALEKQGHFPSAAHRGYKSDIWEGGHRVPFLARWPGRIAPGSTSTQLVCLVDLFATCADLLGQPVPDGAAPDSVSLLPALLGTDTVPLREAVVHHSIEGAFAIRQANWKLCLCPDSGGWSKGRGAESVQLYDLNSDPGETRNLAATHPSEVARLTALLQRYVDSGRSTPGPRLANDVPVQIAKKSQPTR